MRLMGDVHAGAAFRVRRRTGRGLVHQWTSSALTTPRPWSDRLANVIGTRLANWGTWIVQFTL